MKAEPPFKINDHRLMEARALSDTMAVVICEAPAKRAHRYAVWYYNTEGEPFAFDGGYHSSIGPAAIDFMTRR